MAEIASGREAGRRAALAQYAVLDSPPEDAFDQFTRLAQQIFRSPIALITLVDGERQWFKSRRGLELRETPREISFCAHAIADDAVLVVPDAHADPRFSDNPLVTGAPHIRFYAGAPLRTPEGYNIGTICVIDDQPRAIDENEIATLDALATMVVRELELRLLATTDSLTGVLNRREFLRLGRREVSRSARHRHPLSVLALDLDHFNRVNERYGHAVGDAVLKHVGASCLGLVRAHDFVGRMGGEEFAIMLPETSVPGALTLAERLHLEVSALAVVAEGGPVRITTSIGVATLIETGDSFEAVLQRADAALRAAKDGGRNRIVTPDAA